MTQRLVEREDEGGVVGLQPRRERVESPLDFRVRRRAQKDELRAAVEGAPCGVLDQVHALLFRQARHHRDDGSGVPVPTRKTQPSPKRVPCRLLPCLCGLGVVRHWQKGIVRGVPDVGVDPVAHPAELARIGSDGGQPRNLPRVRGGNSGEGLRVVRGVADRGEAEVRIVDREDGARRGQAVAVVVVPEEAGDGGR